MLLCELTITPLGAGESVSKEVARIIDIIDKSGISYQTHAMGTILEGEWDAVMELVKQCHFAMRKRHQRVLTTLHIDDRSNTLGRLTGKVDAIENRLKRTIKR